MYKLFSPKELAKLYNRIKITHNPLGYSFRDRLVEYSNTTPLAHELIQYVDYDTEQSLLSKIWSFWKVSGGTPGYGRLGSKTNEWEDWNDEWCSLKDARSLNILPQPNSAIFVSTDHLCFHPSAIVRNLPSKLGSEIKKNNVLEGLITACYILTTPKSIAADLKWACTNMHTYFDYENLHSLQFLKDALAEKNPKKLYALYANTSFDNVNCPYPSKEYTADPCGTFADDLGMLEAQMTAPIGNMEVYKEALKLMYLETIAFGLEFVYIVNNHTSTYTNRLIYEISTGSMKGISNTLTELIYKKDMLEFQPAIDLPDNHKERFEAILKYIQSPEVTGEVDAMCNSFTGRHGYQYIPSLMGAIISFAKNYSCRNIRVKQCAILYNYCKTNKLIKTSDPSSDPLHSDTDEHTSEFFKAIENSATELEEGETSRKSMLEMREERLGMKGMPNSGHDSTSVSQALDGMIDNFRTEKYGFTVKDVYSDNDSLKSQYEAITSKIKLVNSQLIKQIRDIKTYNVGGKYAGLSSGKLDRKNLHKYKTDKNIFYQNTYKQKECDLAFGIVLDASGSMCGRGINDGKITMIVLHETLKALGINHSIIDHTCYGKSYTSDLRRYQCFKEDKGYRLRKNYALAGITAESGNCDSGALWFMEKALLRTKNRDKICLIFSDGAPTECSGADLVAQVKHMEHVGIKVIGIGINFSNISKYYTDYANGKNLKEMLNIVADILKEYVIAKKD